MSIETFTFVSSSTGTTPDTSITTAAVFENISGNMIYSSDDTRAVYIDWSDGEDNSRTKANYQWVEDVGSTTQTTAFTETPITIFPHVYTATGTFAPIFQTVNSDGIFSKYYGSGASTNYNNPPQPYSSRANVTGIKISDGTATGVMRTENTTVKSGIDNSIFQKEGAGPLYLAVAPLLADDTELDYFNPLKLTIEAVLDYSVISNLSGTAKIGGGSELINKKIDIIVSGTTLTGSTGFINLLESGNNGSMPDAASSGAAVSQILKVTYKNPKIMGSYKTDYTRNAATNKFKVFLLTTGSDGYYHPITYVTPGMPIKSAEDPDRFTILDFGQSRAKASNGGIEKYRYDTGKSWFNPADRWGVDASGNFTDATSTQHTTIVNSYTYLNRPNGLRGGAVASESAWPAGGEGTWVVGENYRTDQFTLNDFGQFYEQQHLTRMTAQPSGSGTTFYGDVSPVSSNKPIVMRITPAVSWGGADVPYFQRFIDATPIASGGFSSTYTSGASNNLTGQTGLVSLSGMNSTSFTDISGQARDAQEYMILLFDKKTDSLFFEMSNYAASIQSNPVGVATGGAQWGIGGIYYLNVSNKDTPKQKVDWKPLKFEDHTAIHKEYRAVTGSVSGSYRDLKSSLSKSGVISFDMPINWTAISANSLIGGIPFFSAHTVTSSTFDIAVTGEVSGAVQAGTSYGQYQVVTGATISSSMEVLGDVQDVGALEYLFLCTKNAEFAGNASGQAFWLTKDGDNGWDGDKGLFVHLGTSSLATPLTTGEPVEGIVRPINAYDFFDGFSKVNVSGTNYTTLPTIDASSSSESAQWPNYYMIAASGAGLSGNIGYSVMNDWGTNEKYALKIVLSGSQTDIDSYPEIWNILDAREGNISLITEVDDSAYNLNSLAITSSLSHSQKGQYFRAITRKGKVYIVKTGLALAKISLKSVALGDEGEGSDAFERYGAEGTLYHHLHMMRKLQTENVLSYWDEPQKDGTFIRIWGRVTGVNETFNVGGPRRVVDYTAEFDIESIALLDVNGELMTDIFPLGGIADERTYT